MQFRNRNTGLLIDEAGLRNLNQNVSFPLNLTSDIIDQFGYDPVFEGPQPDVKPPYETLERAGVIQISGKWYTNYVVGPLFKEYTDANGIIHTVKEQQDEYCLKKDNEQAFAIRQQRNFLLKDSDWTQLEDSSLDIENKNSWRDYRKLLRDLPTQEKFPWEVNWPEKPL